MVLLLFKSAETIESKIKITEMSK